jgi:threonine dehydratase
MEFDQYRSLATRFHETLCEAIDQTPIHDVTLSGVRFMAKREDLQVTGSFKVRGALLKLQSLNRQRSRFGVVCASAGNHGKGVAWAASRLGIIATVVVPRGTPAVKKRGIAELGAELVEYDAEPGYDAAESWARELAARQSAVFVSPFDDPLIQAGGGGTIALEILNAVPDVERIVVPVGGGGLAAGLGAVVHAIAPLVEIVGAQSSASPAMARSLRDGRPHLTWPAAETLAEGLEGGVARSTFEACRLHLTGVVEVDETEIGRAMAQVRRERSIVLEGSAAVAVAAVTSGSIPAGPRTVVVFTGSNVDPERIEQLLCAHG